MTTTAATLLLTRPFAASHAFAEALRAEQPELPPFDLVVSPLIEIVPTEVVPDFGAVQGIIFTSASGVGHAGDPHDLPVYCVGEGTADRARALGWRVARIAPTADDLVKLLLQDPPNGPLTHIAGVHRRGEIAERLTGSGLPTSVQTVYDQDLHDLSEAARRALSGHSAILVPLFSPRTACQFAAQTQGTAMLHLIAISEAVMQQADRLRAGSRIVACTPDRSGMLEAVGYVLSRVEAGGAPQ